MAQLGFTSGDLRSGSAGTTIAKHSKRVGKRLSKSPYLRQAGTEDTEGRKYGDKSSIKITSRWLVRRTGTHPWLAVFLAQETQNEQLTSLARQMHYQLTKVTTMSRQQYVKSGICEKYQTLLEECGDALSNWDRCRARVAQFGQGGKEASKEELGDEIFGLQAKYARAYAALQKHLHECVLCQLIARYEGAQSSEASTLYGESYGGSRH